jgi:SpoVK/Ycf46/Vps4 family AAA+-type ATPase
LKETLLNQAILNFSIRPKLDPHVIPLHGIFLLVGPPGTGKTSLARGLAAKLAGVLNQQHQKLTYIEIEPHSLTSSAHGRTQRAVTDLFGKTVVEYASANTTFILLDEVETLLADRAKLSLEANPVDVHRATDAALVQLDLLATKFRNLLIVATSNFEKAIDEAFISRSDLVLNIPLPDEAACFSILKDTISKMSKPFPGLKKIIEDSGLKTASENAVGLDGRQIRKAVAGACTFRREAALDPNKMTLEDLARALARARKKGSL